MAGYCTVDEVRRSAPDVELDLTYNEALEFLSEAASRLVDGLCRVEPGGFAASAEAVRWYQGDGGGLLLTDQMAAAPSLVRVDVTGLGDWQVLAAGTWDVWPKSAVSRGRPYLGLTLTPAAEIGGWPVRVNSIEVTSTWGYSLTIPERVKQAVAIQAVRWLRRGQQGFADTGAIIELGQLRYVQKLDPDIELLLDGFDHAVV